MKVLLRGPDGEVETPWVHQAGENLYRLDDLPFFTYGISWQDVIGTELRDGANEFVRVVEKSGNRTVRVILDEPANEPESMEQLLARLTPIGCACDRMTQRYIVVNVPPETDLSEVCEYLISAGQQWEHADPTYEALYPDENEGGTVA